MARRSSSSVMQVYGPERLAVYAAFLLRSRGVLAMGAQDQVLPGRAEGDSELSIGTTEHVCREAKCLASFQDRRKATVQIEGHAPVLGVLGVSARNGELMVLPIHMQVLDPQHFSLATARLERPNDAVVHRLASPRMLL
jgi:hypothetical protein